MASVEKQCTFLVYHTGERPAYRDIRAKLEKGTDDEKLHLNGEPYQHMLMPIIQHVVPSRNKLLKKMSLMYWEIIDKTGKDGKLLPELILSCSHFRLYLEHPNEYIRGCTLRFITKIKEFELLQPLIGPIVANLEHRHSYVRRNAVLAVYSIFQNHSELIPDASDMILHVLKNDTDAATKRNAFIMLFECDPPKAIEHLLSLTIDGRISTQADSFQLVVLNLLRKLCKTNPNEKNNYLGVIISLMDTKSTSVMYQCAYTLTALTSSPPAIKASAQCYVRLLTTHPDNNVKLIVLDRLEELKEQYKHQMQQQSEIIMDLMHCLSIQTLSVEIKQRVLDLVMGIVSTRTVDYVMIALKKEINASVVAQQYGGSATGAVSTPSEHLTNKDTVSNGKGDKASPADYRRLLIQALHKIATKFPDQSEQYVLLVMDYLNDRAATEVVYFVRDAVEQNGKLRDIILEKLCQQFGEIISSKVFRTVMWILGDYSERQDQILAAFQAIKDSLQMDQLLMLTNGTAPTSTVSTPAPEDDAVSVASSASTAAQNKPAVRADGTYISQSADISAAPGARGSGRFAATKSINLRSLVQEGNFFVATVVCSTLVKLVMRLFRMSEADVAKKNELLADAMAACCALLRIGAQEGVYYKMDKDTCDRICLCVKLLMLLLQQAGPDASAEVDKSIALTEKVLFQEARDAFSAILKERKLRESTSVLSRVEGAGASAAPAPAADGTAYPAVVVPADYALSFFHLRPGAASSALKAVDAFDEEQRQSSAADIDDGKSVLSAESNSPHSAFFSGSRLQRVVQLTGFSDTVYAEAIISMHQYDISLDMLIVNQTTDTLYNLVVELFTVGDLKLVEPRAQEYTLGPQGSTRVKSSIKVSSTDTGIIFGSIVYEVAGGKYETQYITLNDVHLDILDYIHPAYCRDVQFRTMWIEFEWENKISVKYDPEQVKVAPGADKAALSNLSLPKYLSFIADCTNMQVLTSDVQGQDDESEMCAFLSANMYARSTFGEDALANVSIEKLEDGKIEGFVRIRSKTQGIALALGNIISKATKEWQQIGNAYAFKHAHASKGRKND